MNMLSMQPFAQFKTPIVILDSYFDTLDYDCVLINNIQGAFVATDYLINRRKQQPGYLRSAYSISNFEERADGFYKAIRTNGMSTSKCIVHQLAPSQEGACADMRALIAAGEELAGCYFADNDHIAIGAIHALCEAGYRIPEDIGVVGFDDLPLCEYLSPPLTTIHVPKQYMGETAVARMAQIIEEKSHSPVKIEIETTLIRRKSVLKHLLLAGHWLALDRFAPYGEEKETSRCRMREKLQPEVYRTRPIHAEGVWKPCASKNPLANKSRNRSRFWGRTLKQAKQLIRRKRLLAQGYAPRPQGCPRRLQESAQAQRKNGLAKPRIRPAFGKGIRAACRCKPGCRRPRRARGR